METEDFQFDLAIHVELIKWIKKDTLLKEALECPEHFFCFKEGILHVNLSCISQDYYINHIEYRFEYFCNLFGNKLQLLIGDFFFLYDFPPAHFKAEVYKDEMICTLNFNVLPKLYPYNILTVC